MTARAHAVIETQLHRHQHKRQAEDAKVTHLRRQLRTLQREARRKQRQKAGEWVDLAGLLDLDPELLLGGLCALAEMLTDQDTVARWKVVGETKREAHRRRPLNEAEGVETHAVSVRISVTACRQPAQHASPSPQRTQWDV